MALVTTIHGEMEEALLEKREASMENENEITSSVEYWLNDELVHRSVHVQLKRGIEFDADAAVL